MSNTFKSYYKKERFTDFSNSVQFCNLCPRMHHRNRVLSEMNGNLNSDILIIAEAPGRLGADKTGIPLFGDKTGANFQKLLDSVRWSRDDVFITNAVLCNPRNSDGNNDTPNSYEIKNCSVYLKMTINLLKPKYIVTLGRIALESLSYIKPHNLTLKQNTASFHEWNGLLLYPLYHPAPRALIHRSMNTQIKDFQKLALTANPVNEISLVAEKPAYYEIKQNTINFNPSLDILEQTLLFILSQLKEISFFRATKLLYLCDLTSIERYSYSLTGSTYLRQREGPWLPKLRDITNKMRGDRISLYFIKEKPFIKILDTNLDFISLTEEKKQIIEYVLRQYGMLTDRGIKIAAYRTKPMRYILDKEKENLNMINRAVINGDMTIIEIDKNAKI